MFATELYEACILFHTHTHTHTHVDSGGTSGCRCCASTSPFEDPPRDTAGLVAMTGSSHAAALVASAALLVRQYMVQVSLSLSCSPFLSHAHIHRHIRTYTHSLFFLSLALSFFC